MISYAGNREDVLLRRLFPDAPHGFYVDVGAGHPVVGSLTKHFFDRGWRGINIEPAKWLHDRLCEERKGDTNLNVAVAAQAGKMTLYECPPEYWGLSTLSADEAAKQRQAGIPGEERIVEVTTLAHVFETYVESEIDFLSIDVEGLEKDVIEGGDWERWRPRVVIVEATQPNTTVQTHESWEPLLKEARYVFAYFDGLNRFYIREEDADLTDRFSVPVNLFDGFEPYEYVNQIEKLHEGAIRNQSLLVAELVLRESCQATVRSLWDEKRRLSEKIEELTYRLQRTQASSASPLPQDVGPLALSLARVISRMGVRHPRLSFLPKLLVRTAIKIRRLLASPR